MCLTLMTDTEIYLLFFSLYLFTYAITEQMKQAEVLGYGSTWFSLWLWKVMSADAFMHYTLISLFFGKIWVRLLLFKNINKKIHSNFVKTQDFFQPAIHFIDIQL